MNGSMDPSLDDLALFAEVAEAGGFSAAARATGRPQATLSRRIAALEAALGMDLFERSGRRIALTEAGRRVYEHAVLMREQAQAARGAVAEIGGSVTGALNVTAPVVLGQSFVVGVAAEFLRDHPQVGLRVEWTTRRVDPAEEDVDVAIMLGMAANHDLVRLRLGTVRSGLYAPPEYGPELPDDPGALRGVPVVGLGGRLPDRELSLSRGPETMTVSLHSRLASNDVAPVIAAAKACGCLAILPDFCVPEGWRRVLPDWSTPDYEVNAFRTASRGALPKVRLFLDALKAGFEGFG